MALTLKCHPGIGPCVNAIALVAADNFSARYDLDREKGIFSRPTHCLYGQSYVGKILVLNTAKGGVASAWMIRDMAQRGIAPAAFLFNRVNPVLAQGAAFADITLLDRFEGDITTLLKTGDELRVDPEQGLVTVTARSS